MTKIRVSGAELNALLSVEVAAVKPTIFPEELRLIRMHSTGIGARSLASNMRILAETWIHSDDTFDNGFDIQIQAIHAPVLRKRFTNSRSVRIESRTNGEIVFSDNLGEFQLDPLPEPEKVRLVVEIEDQPKVEHEKVTLLNVEEWLFEREKFPTHEFEGLRKYTAVSPEYFGLLNKIQLVAKDDKDLAWEMQQLWQVNEEARVSNFVKFYRKGIGAANAVSVPIADRFEQATIFDTTQTDAAA